MIDWHSSLIVLVCVRRFDFVRLFCILALIGEMLYLLIRIILNYILILNYVHSFPNAVEKSLDDTVKSLSPNN